MLARSAALGPDEAPLTDRRRGRVLIGEPVDVGVLAAQRVALPRGTCPDSLDEPRYGPARQRCDTYSA